MQNASSGVTTKWRVATAAGDSSEDTIAADATLQWRPCWTAGVFDGTVDGVECLVAAAGEWIDIEIYQDYDYDINVYQVIAWAQEDD